MERVQVTHGFPPFCEPDSQVLILGSFPSVKSREQAFFYGHPQNRFWKVMAAVYGEPVPASVPEKRAFLHRNHIALYDVIEACSIVGSADSSIRDVIPADIPALLSMSRVGGRIYVNGEKAHALYRRYLLPLTALPATRLPSTSPANAAWSLERLTEAWQCVKRLDNSAQFEYSK